MNKIRWKSSSLFFWIY